MVDLMDLDLNLEEYENDADAWLASAGDPEPHQQEPEFDRQQGLNQPEVAWEQAPDWSFREYPFEGNQRASAEDWRQYVHHSGYGAVSSRVRADVRGR